MTAFNGRVSPPPIQRPLAYSAIGFAAATLLFVGFIVGSLRIVPLQVVQPAAAAPSAIAAVPPEVAAPTAAKPAIVVPTRDPAPGVSSVLLLPESYGAVSHGGWPHPTATPVPWDWGQSARPPVHP